MEINLGKAPRTSNKESGAWELFCDDLRQNTISESSRFLNDNPRGLYIFKFSFTPITRGNMSSLKLKVKAYLYLLTL